MQFCDYLDDDKGFNFLIISRVMRSMAIIFMTLAAPLYLNLLKISLPAIGVVYVAIMIFAAVLSMALGAFGDRYGFRKALIIGEILPAIAAVVIFISTNDILIIIAMVIGGLGGLAGGMRGMFSTGTTPLIASNYRDEKVRVRKMAQLSVAASSASLIGAAMLAGQYYLSIYVGDVGAYKILYLVAALMMLISFISLFFLKEDTRPEKSTKIMKRESFGFLKKIIVINLVNGAALGLTIPLLPLWLAIVFKANNFEISVIFAASYIATAAGSYIASKKKFKDILNAASVIRIMQGIMLLLMGGIAILVYFSYIGLVIGLLIIALLFLLRSILGGFGTGPVSIVNISGIDKEDFGTASSVMGLSSSFGQTSSGAAAVLMNYIPGDPFIIGGILQVAVGMLYKKLLKGEKRDN
jgi:MFS family permease